MGNRHDVTTSLLPQWKKAVIWTVDRKIAISKPN